MALGTSLQHWSHGQAGQSSGELENIPAAAPLGQSLMGAWGPGIWAGWKKPQEMQGKDNQGCWYPQSPWEEVVQGSSRNISIPGIMEAGLLQKVTGIFYFYL